jgi:hypothetical protein
MPAPPPPHSTGRPFWRGLSLAQLQRLRYWRQAQRERRQYRLECAAWEGVLTVWMLGWTAWLPAVVLGWEPLLPLCLAGTLLPQTYVYARWRAHANGSLRCDWLDLLE